ncbi:type VI secretion system baseplate subunit TssG [Geomonas ferrireducens]|uniref:type VI secretion system baseplate subunit TssG n=1 Tax=Geomonas ferrireducens TaxID=2570227 RepID=UPI001FE731B1|nr:type VI secretion system baseplate subunit TssG [Geomonas ferrireducens]
MKRNALKGARFFQVVQLLERMHPSDVGVGEAISPDTERIRFKARKGFAFPAGDVAGVSCGADGVVQVEVAHMGLVGPSGMLPHWYHELVLARETAKDHSMGDFYDLFHHRLVSLFYRAWKRNALLPQKKRDHSDVFSSHLFSFLGLGTGGLREHLAALEAALLHFCGEASRQGTSAGTIARMVTVVFGVKADVEPFVPRVAALEPSDQATLGQANCRLGVDAVCGSETRDVQSTFRVCLGPMRYEEFVDLSGVRKLRHLVSLVRFLSGLEYEIEIRLVLKKDEVPVCRLGCTSPDAPRLGHSIWMKDPAFTLDEDPFVTIHPDEIAKQAASEVG